MARDLLLAIRRTLTELQQCGARTALVGGMAFGLRIRPRSTKDIDFAVAVASDAEAERLVGQLLRSGCRTGAILEHADTGRLATARLYLPGSSSLEPDAYLIFASCGIEPEVVAAASPLLIDGIGRVPVARIGHLIAMKCLSESDRREQDRVDLRALVEAADGDDLALAAEAIEQIDHHGYARGKDLRAVLASFVQSQRR